MSSLNNKSEEQLIENNKPKIKAANEPKASGENISIDYSSIADKFIDTYKDNVFVYHTYVDEFLNGYISKIMNPSLTLSINSLLYKLNLYFLFYRPLNVSFFLY